MGMQYRYVFNLGGVKFFIHHHPPKNRQAVRIRYSADALIGRSLFSIHRGVRSFLHEIGFSIQIEKISRLDLQILMACKASDLVLPILAGHGVCKAENDDIRRKSGKIQTYTVVSVTKIQLCIYDKKAEMKKMMVSDPVKWRLMVEHCTGEDWYFSNKPITRVEFRLRRDSLRALDIHSVEDLRLRETALVDWLTDRWFRLLKEPKVRGHKNTATLHPLWEEVRNSFQKWFAGVDGENKPVEWHRSESVSCDSTALVKIAVGCMAKAAALENGVLDSSSYSFSAVMKRFHQYKDILHEKALDCAQRVKIGAGVILGPVMGEP